jgi:putative NADH-flavin reductase
MTTKRILVLGATGGTGRHIVLQALEQGHAVTVLVRDPRRLHLDSDRVRVVVGSADDEDAVASAACNQDVVISALGAGASLRSGGVIARTTPVILRAMERNGVRRLILMSAFGAGDTYQYVPLMARIMIRTLLRDLYADKNVAERALRRDGGATDWTLVYPVSLTNGARTGRYRSGKRLSLHGFPRISRADEATFMLAQIDDTTYVKKGVLVSS